MFVRVVENPFDLEGRRRAALNRKAASVKRALNVGSGPISAPGEERRPALVDQHSVRSAISNASSTSMQGITGALKFAMTKQEL